MLKVVVGFDVIRFILKVLAKLEEAWINERNSPELLHPRMEMVGMSGHGQDGRYTSISGGLHARAAEDHGGQLGQA